jgi:hypothetical protein
MAGIEMQGMDQLKQNVANLQKMIADEALVAAQDAAAQVIKEAVEEAAPRRTGQLASSVKIFKVINRKALMGSNRMGTLVGPDKKKGFYGYFVDKGWLAGGPHRRKRASTATTHSQSGSTEGRHKIAGTKWFDNLTTTVTDRAYEAGEKAIADKIQQSGFGD